MVNRKNDVESSGVVPLDADDMVHRLSSWRLVESSWSEWGLGFELLLLVDEGGVGVGRGQVRYGGGGGERGGERV